MAEDAPGDLIRELAMLFVEATGRPYGEARALLQQAHQELVQAVEGDLPETELNALKARIVRRMLSALRTLQ